MPFSLSLPVFLSLVFLSLFYSLNHSSSHHCHHNPTLSLSALIGPECFRVRVLCEGPCKLKGLHLWVFSCHIACLCLNWITTQHYCLFVPHWTAYLLQLQSASVVLKEKIWFHINMVLFLWFWPSLPMVINNNALIKLISEIWKCSNITKK